MRSVAGVLSLLLFAAVVYFAAMGELSANMILAVAAALPLMVYAFGGQPLLERWFPWFKAKS